MKLYSSILLTVVVSGSFTLEDARLGWTAPIGVRQGLSAQVLDGVLSGAECVMDGLGMIINWVDYVRRCLPSLSTLSSQHGEEQLWDLLGWPSMPHIVDRVGAEHARHGVVPEGFLITESESDMKMIESYIGATEFVSGHSLRRIVGANEPVGLKWLSGMDGVFPYDAYYQRGMEQTNIDVLKQIRKDIARPGLVGPKVGALYADDCTAITVAYAAGFNAKMGYSQGMVDWCLYLKHVGGLDNANAFNALVFMVEDITKLYNRQSEETDSFTRSFGLVQMYSAIFKIIKPDFGNILDSLEAAALADDQLPWELSANVLELHFLSMGTRGANIEETIPIVNFIFANGRPGLVALFFAKLELHYVAVMHALEAESGGSYFACKVLNQLVPVGSTVEALVEKAQEYLESPVGLVNFVQTVGILDILVERQARN